MATIGLDKPFYAKITEDENGNESYGTPKVMAKAIDVDLSIELLQAILYADDGADVEPSSILSKMLLSPSQSDSAP